MNDRPLDNQFPANSLNPEQLRQLNNILGLLGGNLNLVNPVALQNILNPILANSVAANNTPLNLNDSAPTYDQSQQQQQQRLQQQQQQQQQHQANRSTLPPTPSSQLAPQSQASRGKQPKKQRVDQSPSNINLGPRAGPLTTGSCGPAHSGRPLVSLLDGGSEIPALKDVGAAAFPAPGNFANPLSIDGFRPPGNVGNQLQQTMRLLRQQQQQQELTQQLQQQLQQIVQNSQRQQNPLPSAMPEQRRKRGRPPLSAPSTSMGTSSGIDYSYLNMFAAVKNQQEKERLQREAKLQQDRQRELRQQQQDRERQRELRIAQERAERQRELRQQQDRERQRELRLAQERAERQRELQRQQERAELERQRKLQHRQAIAEIERERRRQHLIMIKNLDAYKRNEEREKTMNAMMAERNKQLERRMYQKRLEVELIKDIRKPVDDMLLKNHKPLATLNRIPGLKLPGKAFADLLMSYEFLCNFGETVGLDLKDIPDINTLQQGLLNLNAWAEDQFISVLHHLCMFAIRDPRFPYAGSTKEIELLEKTNEGLSQLLHFYLQVLTLNAKTDMVYESRLYKLIEQKYFLSLNATQKAEMLAFMCNELLCSQTVTKQIEDTIENVAKLRKDKWVLENELRKYRAVKTKRELREEAEQRAKDAAAAAAAALTNGESEKANDGTVNKDLIKAEGEENDEEQPIRSDLANGSSIVESIPNRRENETDTSAQPNNSIDLDDLEPGMTNEELNKKLENLTRQYNKTSNKLEKAINSMRASPLGQDRYRRRYWVLPQVGGVFVEGMESSEPEELENNKFTEEELLEYEKEEQALNAQAEEAKKAEQEAVENGADPDRTDIKEEKDDDEIEMKDEAMDVKDEDEVMDGKEDDVADATESKDESRIEPVENGGSEVDKNAVETITDGANVPAVPNIPWFSILPRQSCDFTKPPQVVDNEIVEAEEVHKKVREEDGEIKTELTSDELRAKRHEICPVLAKKLEELEAEQYDTPRKIHPQYQCGWWRITDAQQLKSILAVLHERGSRERILHKHLTKHFQYACNSCKNTTVDFEITSYDRELASRNYGAPMQHTDEDSADDLKDGEEEDEEEEELDEETGDHQPTASAPSRKSKRKKTSRSARSRRLRARAAARKKVENSRNQR